MTADALVQKGQEILANNWRGRFSVPCNKLYPFQWNWDSGFVSLGFAHFSKRQMMQEWVSLFSGQWQNGMIPHILFHSEKETTYFPNYDFWDTTVNDGAPQSPKTSGITQPPVHGFVLEAIYQMYRDDAEVVAFVKAYFPKVVASHRYFYDYRDPAQEGLFYIYHPWESGRDNSPIWDESLDRIVIEEGSLPPYERKDTSHADASERPSTYQYDRYVYLLELGKRHQYDGEGIAEESPLLIQDTLMNAVLIRSNQALIALGEELAVDTAQIQEWNQQSMAAYRYKLWHEELQYFAPHDMRTHKLIAHREIGGIVPIYTALPSRHQADSINNYLRELHRRDYYICPSFDVDSPLFDSKRYWRGPIWPQMNWMIHRGLAEHGYHETAAIVKNDLIELVTMHGFHEYFEAQKSVARKLDAAYGGKDFSWTASSIIDLILSA